jgi:hypothetical protein
MQVTNDKLSVVQASVGTGDPIEFGISNSPEFFHILSDNLYKDPVKAMVREILTNAVDANIEAGKEDIPVEISFDRSHLIIKDQGNGIPHDKIRDIYGIYGSSTKKENTKVTGGFGLGCKAPFAYTDSFTVTSCNGGQKVIYQLCKSDSNAGGKPTITPILSTPTTETGVTVKINVKGRDSYDIENNIKELVFQGGMNASLNGKMLPRVKTGSFIYLTQCSFGMKVGVRYGHNVFMLDENNEMVSQFIRKYVDWRFQVMLTAEPNSLVINPGREDLVYCEKTLKTLADLFNKAKDIIEHTNPFKKNTLVTECLTDPEAVAKSRTDNVALAQFVFASLQKKGILYTNNWGLIALALNKKIKSKYLRKLPCENTNRLLSNTLKCLPYFDEDQRWYQKNRTAGYIFFRGILRHLSKFKFFSEGRFYIPAHDSFARISTSICAYSDWMKNRIAFDEKMFDKRISIVLKKSDIAGQSYGMVISRAQAKKVEEIKQAFEHLGFIVDIHTSVLEASDYVLVRKPRLKKKYFSIKGIAKPDARYSWGDTYKYQECQSVEEPKYVMLIPRESTTEKISVRDMEHMLKYHPNDTVMVPTTAVYDSLIKKGAKNYSYAIRSDMEEYFKKYPKELELLKSAVEVVRLKQLKSAKYEKSSDDYDYYTERAKFDFLRDMLQISEVRKRLGYTYDLVHDTYYYYDWISRREEFEDIDAYFRSIPLSDKAKRMLKILSKRTFIPYCPILQRYSYTYSSHSKDPAVEQEVKNAVNYLTGKAI